MPIGTALANNLKVNNIIGPSNNTTIMDPSHLRDMSLDDDRNNNNRRQNINTAGTNKADIIASRIVNQSKSPDRYVIGNNLVVNLNGSPDMMNQTVYNNSSVASSQGKPVATKGSIFPSTTTATTANSLGEKN
jgi:hypothetical protein